MKKKLYIIPATSTFDYQPKDGVAFQMGGSGGDQLVKEKGAFDDYEDEE